MNDNVNYTINENNSIQGNENAFGDKQLGKQNIIQTLLKNKKIVLPIVSIIILAILSILIYNLFFNSNNKKDLRDASSFFLKNNEYKYALFSNDGHQLTDFVFTDVSDFFDDAAYVEKGEEYGIISTSGKMLVNFGKYSDITDRSGLYEVSTEDDHEYLIDKNGKVLYNLDDIYVKSYGGNIPYLILEYRGKRQYSIIDNTGRVFLTIPEVSGAKDIESSEMQDYISIFYDNKNYILNGYTGEQLVSFDSDYQYKIYDISEDGKIIILNATEIGKKLKLYKIIRDGKLLDVNNECEYVYIKENTLFCKVKLKDYYLGNDGNKSYEVTNAAYSSDNHYAVDDLDLMKGVTFYSEGKTIKNIPCRKLEHKQFMSNNIYILQTLSSEKCKTESIIYEYYNSNGEKIFNSEFMDASNFDEKGRAIVSKDKKNYYLIDTEGNQIGKMYSNIQLEEDFYIVTKDKKKGVMDINGNEIVPCKYSNISIDKNLNINFALAEIEGSKNILYNLDNKKEIISLNEDIYLNDHYFKTNVNSKTQFYSYITGKMFYEG